MKIDLFYDANCFATIPEPDLEYFISESNNKITNTVYDEILKGFNKYPDHDRFKLVINKNNELHENYQLVSLQAKKKLHKEFRDDSIIYLKENPIVCSAYYTWLPHAVNPAIITDINRHLFNNMLFEMKRKGDAIEKDWYKYEDRWRKNEAQEKRSINEQLGRVNGLDPVWLLKTRPKRINEIKAGPPKLTDYQLVVAALLYACLKGKRVYILTSDRDLLDIHNNLMEGIIESYTLSELLKAKTNLAILNRDKLDSEGITLSISHEEIHSQLEKTVSNIEKGEQQFTFGILFYKQDDNKIYKDINIIPLWLRDFIIEYRNTIDCYSIPIHPNHKLQYIMDPTQDKRKVLFKLRYRKPVSNRFITDCEDICIYAKKELEDPTAITGFMDRSDFDNW